MISISSLVDKLQEVLSNRSATLALLAGAVVPTSAYALLYFLKLRSSPLRNLDKASSLVVITGCDTGFGYMLALALTARGYPVIATCYTAAGVKALQEQKVFRALQCDVTKAEDVQRVAEAMEDIVDKSKESKEATRYKVWAVVNNAGIAPTGLVDYLPMSAARQVMEVNYFAVIQVIQSFLPQLKTVRDSRIINVSSAAGFSGFPGGGYYCGSKHAIEGLMKCLRQELLGWNIHVCNVNPGFMKTPLIVTSEEIAVKAFRDAPKNISNQYPEEQLRDLTKFIHMVEEDPIKVVNQMIRLIESKNPLLINPTGWQANVIRWATWLTPHHLHCHFEKLMFLNSKHGPYPDIVKSMQRDTKKK